MHRFCLHRNHWIELPLRAVCLIGLSLVAGGCASPPGARYVYQDGEFGVIGIPCNTIADKADYRAQAESLMARHFPAGYEIVRAEEVVEGQRTLNVGTRTEIDAEPILTVPSQILALGRLGRSKSYEEKDQLQIRECRIIYKRKSDSQSGAPQPSPFAAVATLNPPLYINPNDVAQRPAVASAAPATKPVAYADGEKASNSGAK